MSALSTGRQRPETAAGLAFSAGRGGASLPVLSALTEAGHELSASLFFGTRPVSVSAFTERSTNGLALVKDVGRARRRGTTGGSRPNLLRGDPMAASEKRTPACELVERPTLTEGEPWVEGAKRPAEERSAPALASSPSVSVRARPARPGAAMWRGQTGRAADSRVLPFRPGCPFPPRGGVRC